MLKITRRELFDLMWTTPMTELARQFNVRDLHIARACDANSIPRPPTGHWQKRAYKVETVVAPPLPVDSLAADHMVVVDSTPRFVLQPARQPRDGGLGRS